MSPAEQCDLIEAGEELVRDGDSAARAVLEERRVELYEWLLAEEIFHPDGADAARAVLDTLLTQARRRLAELNAER